MLPGMQTFDEFPLVTAFEPCAVFSAAGDGSPACTGCGWLHDEHLPAADVHRLAPRRDRTAIGAVAPRRLAS